MANWELIGQAVGICGIVVTGAYGVWRGHKKGDGKPPEIRPPPANELKAMLDAMAESQKRIERGLRDFVDTNEDNRRELMREVYRMGTRIEMLQGRGSDR